MSTTPSPTFTPTDLLSAAEAVLDHAIDRMPEVEHAGQRWSLTDHGGPGVVTLWRHVPAKDEWFPVGRFELTLREVTR